uniref:TIMELESS-interacting protein n=1 Tax=Sphenodon punctatus TaxID=8508 RepID=A0A8D0H715_SPHPU
MAMMDPLESNLFDLPDYEHTEDERFPPLPPPASQGRDDVEGAFLSGEPDGNGLSDVKDPPATTRKTVRRQIPKLDAQRLVSERGLTALRHIFDSAKFKGKGHEAEDLKTLVRHLEHWAHRLFPKLKFEDFVERIEYLGNKKAVQTCLKQIRLDLPILHEDFTSNEGVDGESNEVGLALEDLDPFPETKNKGEEFNSPSSPTLTEEQRQRIERNRQIALEKRQAKMQVQSQSQENDFSAVQLNEELDAIVTREPNDVAETEAESAASQAIVANTLTNSIQLERAEDDQCPQTALGSSDF